MVVNICIGLAFSTLANTIGSCRLLSSRVKGSPTDSFYVLGLFCFFCGLFFGPLEAHSGESYQTFLKPYRIAGVASAQRDLLSRLYVEEGEHVTKGQLLVDMDHRQLKARLDLSTKSASFVGPIDSARALVKMRKIKITALKKLEKRGNAKPQELIAAQTNLEMSQAQLRTTREDKSLRELELKVILAQIEEKKLYSPFDGIVTQVHRYEGELVGGTTSEPILTLVQLDPLLADFHLPPESAKKLKSGMSVQLQSEDNTIKGEVTFISPVINAQSNTMMVRMTLPNPDGRLLGGMRVNYTTSQ